MRHPAPRPVKHTGGRTPSLVAPIVHYDMPRIVQGGVAQLYQIPYRFIGNISILRGIFV